MCQSKLILSKQVTIIIYWGPKIWNSLPVSVTFPSSLLSFKTIVQESPFKQSLNWPSCTFAALIFKIIYVVVNKKSSSIRQVVSCSLFGVFLPYTWIIVFVKKWRINDDDDYFWKQLDQSGVYKFKVKVTAVDQSYGYAFINVTVLPGE